MQPPGIGAFAPDFSFLDASGGAHTLGEFLGDPVIVIFREAHAAPLPLQHLTFEGERVTVISPSRDVARLYSATHLLVLYVVGREGTVVWRHAAGADELPPVPPVPSMRLSRREFIATLLAASLAASLASAETTQQSASVSADAIDVVLVVNGRHHPLSLEPRVTLLDALRERLGLTGTKKGCDHGQCGACTVHVDGRRVLSCLTLAASVDGRSITTIEGLARDDRLHPLQQAFIDHDGFQCGYCTSGQIMSAVALLREPCGPDDDDVRECMSGNICRCGAYAGIVAAVQAVRSPRS
jgi:xanthine dehydrogenase YagT iron-sulfur-binding subunit